MSARDRAAFEQTLRHLAPGYNYATISYIAIRAKDSEPDIVLQCDITLEVVQDKYFPDRSYQTASLVAGRKTLCINSIDEISKLVDGTPFFVDSVKLSLKLSNSNENDTFFPYYPPAIRSGPRLPTLIRRGETGSSLLSSADISEEGLNWELRASTQPFDSIFELQNSLGMSQTNLYDGSTINIYLKAPLLITNESHISDGNINAHILLSGKLDTSNISVGYKFLSNGQWTRSIIPSTSISWLAHENPELQTGSAKISCGTAHIAELFVSYDGFALHQWWTVDLTKIPNARYASFTLHDPGLDKLKALLLPSGSRGGDELEHGTSILFHLLGFSACTYGRIPRLQEVPDVIAFSATGNILLIECTLFDINNNVKLSKLSARTIELKDKLTSAGLAHLDVQPVIVTALERRDISKDDLALAALNQIAVLAREDVQSLTNEATIQQPNSELIYTHIRNLIPIRENAQSS